MPNSSVPAPGSLTSKMRLSTLRNSSPKSSAISLEPRADADDRRVLVRRDAWVAEGGVGDQLSQRVDAGLASRQHRVDAEQAAGVDEVVSRERLAGEIRVGGRLKPGVIGGDRRDERAEIGGHVAALMGGEQCVHRRLVQNLGLGGGRGGEG